MDDLTVHIDSLVIDGRMPLDGDALAESIRAHTGDLLAPEVLSQVSHALAASLAELRQPGQGA